jgi:hypothetical protein
MSHHNNSYKEQWWKEAWRPAAAAVYLIICLLDFGVMPLVYEWINYSLSNQSLVDLALKFTNPTAQIEALHTLKQSRVWVPLTLQGNGMFHVAYGAILGVAAFTRGQEKVAWASVGLQPGGYTSVNSGGYGQMGGYGNQAFNGMGNNGGFNGGMQQGYGMNPMANMGMGGMNTGMNNGMNNNMPNNQFNNRPNNMNQQATPKPAVDAGPSLDVVNPDDNNE